MAIYTTDLKTSLTIERTAGDNDPVTTIELLNKTVQKTPDKVALCYKNNYDSWNKVTYVEYKSYVQKVAKCFIKLGLSQKGVVAILAWNCPEWTIAALAAIHAG
jgi:long-chain-fatty-acid--CoA ligase ACSBG